VKWVKDTTGRLPVRPHYDPTELDRECESFLTDFLCRRYGKPTFPVCTNDLAILLEEEADDLDLYADLSDLGPDVEGYSDFFVEKKPDVRISSALSTDPRRENRYRTTLSHELSHVRFHAPLWKAKQSMLTGLEVEHPAHSQRCTRDSVLRAGATDWLEWQAGYCSGAFLMPASLITPIVQGLVLETGLFSPISDAHPVARTLILRVQEAFRVSSDAARVRLLRMGYLWERSVPVVGLFTQELP
jgi:hypothetical protein